MKDTCHLYTDLAWLWPLWGDAATEYAHYCEHVKLLMRRYAERPITNLLDIGCGSGKNVLNLKRDFDVTGLDLSPTMLAQTQELNPECTFVQGDMRTFQLDGTFDATLGRRDHAHELPGRLRGGVPHGLYAPESGRCPGRHFGRDDRDVPAEQDHLPPATRDGLDVVFIENLYDPELTDEQYEATILSLIRDHGRRRIETEHWTMGLFSLDTWRQFLRETGFQVHEGL